MHKRVRQFISALEIGGGFFGMGLTSTLAWTPGTTWGQTILIGAMGLPFAVCAYAGQALWRDQPRGYALSALVQVFQIPAWSGPGAMYIFDCGAKLGVWFTPERLGPMAAVGSHLTLSWAD